MILQAKFHVVPNLRSVSKIVISMLAFQYPHTPLNISLPDNETMENLKSASFLVTMLLHEGLTHATSRSDQAI